MIGNRFYGANNSQVKIGGMLLARVGKSVGVEARNTHTFGAEAGEVNEMN
jgi:hypothetical protein